METDDYEDIGIWSDWMNCLPHSNCWKNCCNPHEGLIQYRTWKQTEISEYCDIQYRCTNCGHETWLVDYEILKK